MKKDKTTDLQFKKELQIISDLTDNNCHTEARQKIAQMFDMKDYFSKFRLIGQLHDIEGYMPDELSNYRQRLSKEMMAIIKNTDIEVYEQIKKCI